MPRIISDENRIKRFRKRWYGYYQTKVDGKYEWRHINWDLHERRAIGVLSGKETTYDQNGSPRGYDLEGGLRDSRIVMFTKAIESDEPCGVIVMPFMAEAFHSVNCGVQFHRTWDGNNSVSPIIISPDPIKEVEEVGPIKDSKKIQFLRQLWESKFEKLNEVLPNVKIAKESLPPIVKEGAQAELRFNNE